jgi:hypothetical protein
MYRSCQLSELLFSGMAVLQQHNPYAIVLRSQNGKLIIIDHSRARELLGKSTLPATLGARLVTTWRQSALSDYYSKYGMPTGTPAGRQNVRSVLTLTRGRMNQLEITQELSELLARQLQTMEDETFLGRNDSDDVSHKRSLRIRALRQELATIAAREQAR